MQCACCGRPIHAKSAWKGASGHFYCGEFCAEAEEAEAATASPPAMTASSLLDLHRQRPYERLQRLLPYMRAYSGQARPASSAKAPLGKDVGQAA
jgi:hypothetical protein